MSSLSGHQYFKSGSSIFLLLGVLLIPFPYSLFSFQQNISPFLLGDLIGWILGKEGEITSDTSGMYVLLIVLFGFAVLWAVTWPFLNKWKSIEKKLLMVNVICTYYLALQLLIYGFNKLFKAQFYLPEPNILYTPLGQISKDLLFWSSMGTSYSYNIFMGLLEIIPALFLLFRKTRLLGLIIVIPVLVNVVAINFSFDISVKVYSLFLLGIALFLIFPQLKKIYDFLVLRKEMLLEEEPIAFQHQPFLSVVLKTFVIGLIFLEVFLPYIEAMNFNDDMAERPYLHGAYAIQNIHAASGKKDTATLDLKRFFIHRKGYIIFQNQADEMQDFKLEMDSIQKQFTLTNYQQQQRTLDYVYHTKDSLLQLQYFKNGEIYWLEGKELNWEELPALQNGFHWTVGGIE